MPTYLIPNRWVDAPCSNTSLEPAAAAAPTATEPPSVTIETVGDYIDAHNLDLMIANPGLRDLPIGAVTVEHDSVAQLTYFVLDGIVAGSASWPMQPDGPEVYAGRGQQAVQRRA